MVGEYAMERQSQVFVGSDVVKLWEAKHEWYSAARQHDPHFLLWGYDAENHPTPRLTVHFSSFIVLADDPVELT